MRSDDPDPLQVMIHRGGDTSLPLHVGCTISGKTSHGWANPQLETSGLDGSGSYGISVRTGAGSATLSGGKVTSPLQGSAEPGNAMESIGTLSGRDRRRWLGHGQNRPPPTSGFTWRCPPAVDPRLSWPRRPPGQWLRWHPGHQLALLPAQADASKWWVVPCPRRICSSPAASENGVASDGGGPPVEGSDKRTSLLTAVSIDPRSGGYIITEVLRPCQATPG